MKPQFVENNEQSYTTAEPRLRMSRECQQGESEYFCGVWATKIYYPVTSATQIPLGEYLIFFASAGEAEAAGYRLKIASALENAPLAEEHKRLAIHLCRYIEGSRHIPTLEELSREAALSQSYLHHLFRKLIGVTPRGFANAVRVRRIWQALRRGEKLSDIIEKSGYVSASRFYLEARHYLGMTPSSFRKGGANAQLHFAVVESLLGDVLFAWTGRGLCALLFDGAHDVLVGRLHQLFPAATLRHADAKSRESMTRLAEEAGAPGIALDLPLDVRQHVFLQRVLQLLKKPTFSKNRHPSKKTGRHLKKQVPAPLN